MTHHYIASGGNPNSASLATPRGSDSPQLSLQSIVLDDALQSPFPETESPVPPPSTTLNLQVFIPELQIQKCLCVQLDDIIWDIKQKLFESLSQPFPQAFNFGFFLPPCEGRAGKFLLEDRAIRDYPFHDCACYVELKYKKRVYKMLKIDESSLKSVHSKGNLKKFIEHIKNRNAEKVEKMCRQGIDPNFHDLQGETPLTIAAGIPNNRDVIVQLIGGGAHLDFRNAEGQTAMHKAAFLSIIENVRTLLELGASPNYRDLIGLTPLYYTMLTTDSLPEIAEMLLADAADLTVLDMHANTALHQACKNGLVKHVEQLLYYGADLNAQNVNGNTPLHVCAVNGRVDCAQVLLYRGANPGALNKQSQTAVHVAQVIGNLVISDIILNHNPNNVVPFRGVPKFNTRRRQTPTNMSQVIRRRSLSHMSMCSSGSVQHTNFSHANDSSSLAIVTDSALNSNFGPYAPGPSTISSGSNQVFVGDAATTSDYGTLRRIHPESVQATPGFEPNIPRILVIPKGPKGFGFILRGAKNVESNVNVPALQFFEGVDMSGMAMRAGLRPGDYLLEINGFDVRRASHEQVVQLIHQSGDIITLKVITIDPNYQQNIYAPGSIASNSGTLRRNHSIPRSTAGTVKATKVLPPQPPTRHPSTGLSSLNGRDAAISLGSCNYNVGASSAENYEMGMRISATPSECRVHHLPSESSSSSFTPTSNNSAGCVFPPGPAPLPQLDQQDGLLSISIDPPHINTIPSQQQLSSKQTHNRAEPVRCASVKARSMVSRRISAVELEDLMVRQSTSSVSSQPPVHVSSSTAQFQPISPATPTPFMGSENERAKRVPEIKSGSVHSANGGKIHQPNAKQSYVGMKRRTQQRNNEMNAVNPYDDPQVDTNGRFSQQQDCKIPQQPQRYILRPKTPPPPPPQANKKQSTNMAPNGFPGGTPAPAPSSSTSQKSSSEAGRGPPPAPPPPPPNLLKQQKGLNNTKSPATTSAPQHKKQITEGTAIEPPQQNNNNTNGEKSGGGKGFVAIAPDILQAAAVKLKPATTPKNISAAAKPSRACDEDFNVDLRNALAKRRTKVQSAEEQQEQAKSADNRNADLESAGNSASTSAIPQTSDGNGSNPVTSIVKQQHYNGLSLRESVRENVGTTAPNKGTSAKNHSPPGAIPFNVKKDSGYTSRTSLEPSENGEDLHHQVYHPTRTVNTIHIANSNSSAAKNADLLNNRNRVTLISQQLEDASIIPSTSITCPSPTPVATPRHLIFENPIRTPAVDYDFPDSGNGDSDGLDSNSAKSIETTTTANPVSNCNDFQRKKLVEWTVGDVQSWLRHLQLNEYTESFASITGVQLVDFSRAKFTKLGVTKIAHRQIMEQSLKTALNPT